MNKIHYKFCFPILGIICICLQANLGLSQTADVSNSVNKKFQAKQLQEDFLILRKAFEDAHAGLYRYTDKKTLDDDFDNAYNLLNREMTEREFYKVVASILSKIKDGHTKSLPSEEFMSYLSEKAKTLPLKLRFICGKAYVVSSSVNSIPLGSELLSFNGQKMSETTLAIFKYLISDGDIKTGKYWELSEKFGYYYYLFIEQPDSFNIEYFDAAKKQKKKLRIPAMTEKEAEALVKRRIEEDKKPLRLEFLPEQNAAILTIKTFAADAIKEAEQDYPKFLENSFREIKEKKIQNLIIDLRGNDGGRDGFGSMLFSYLTDKEFKYYDNLETSTDKISFLKYTTADESFNKMFDDYATPTGSGRFRVKESRHSNLRLQQPQKDNFAGKVWFLVNGQSFSTTAEFCSIAHFHRRGSFVGEEIGGSYYGNTSGTFLILILPNTKVRVLVPLVKYSLAVSGYPYPNRGVIPDYPVQPTIQDVLNGVDTELKYTLGLVSK